ncbi:MAG: succinylglutamate desuccinylase [Pseudomonadota bacterium]
MHAFHSIAYVSPLAGPRLIVTGAVHGNETCGTQAIHRVAAELAAGTLKLARGALTLVPVTNPLAYARRQRQGERNLNRRLAPTPEPREFEDHVANWLCPLLAQHEVLLDLHSFHTPGPAFVMVGPEDNAGPLEPFAHAREEEALAQRVGVRRAVDGWLSTYAKGVQRRREWAREHPGAQVDLDPRYGVGTTEYMRSLGGMALTLECGQHQDPAAPEVAYRAILNTLAHLRLIDAPDPSPAEMELLRLVDVVDKIDAGDRFAREWKSFEPVRGGELIGLRADGSQVLAPSDGFIVFPNPAAGPGQEWFYLATRARRFAA